MTQAFGDLLMPATRLPVDSRRPWLIIAVVKCRLARLVVAASAVVFCLTLVLWGVSNVWSLGKQMYGRGAIVRVEVQTGFVAGFVLVSQDDLQKTLTFTYLGTLSRRYPELEAWEQFRRNFAMARYRQQIVNISPVGTLYYFVLPLWLLTLLSFPLPAISFVRHRRRRRRQQQGLCRRCGYDLRASLERCPECGTPAAKLGS